VLQEETGAASAQRTATSLSERAQDIVEIAIAIHPGIGRVSSTLAEGVLTEGGCREEQKHGRDEKGSVHRGSPHV
jgi:hypothetical protein